MNSPAIIVQQPRIPLRRVVGIAWQGIKVRLLRSALVFASISLAIAFLIYTLLTEAFLLYVPHNGTAQLVESLERQGILHALDQADQAIQTRWMVGLALLISFVGITNSMVMSVSERTREIGTMKCLGATDDFIVRLYIIESLFQGILGTMLGLLIGPMLGFFEGWRTFGGEVWGLLPPGVLILQFAATFVVGVLLTIGGALYPAIRAARMDPIEALRTDV
jgi:putative ABC transport system permease protein